MKKILVFILVTTTFLSVYANKEHSQDIIIKNIDYNTRDNKSFIRFEIDVTKGNTYYMGFWMIPSKLSTGRYNYYDVYCDDNLVGHIRPKKGDWQSILIEDNPGVNIGNGSHIISIGCNMPEIPNIEHIKFTVFANDAHIDGSAYHNYKKGLKDKSINNTLSKEYYFKILADSLLNNNNNNNNNNNSKSYWGPNDNPPYDGTFIIGKTTNYTYFQPVYLFKSQRIVISTEGINNFPHVLEFFYAHGANHSWRVASDSNCNTNMEIIAPKSGTYHIRVRSLINETSGLCNLYINNSLSFEEIPLYSYGVRQIKDKTNIYNSFTCYNNGNPCLWIEEGIHLPGIIRDYNLNYNSNDFDWGLNARIKRQYSCSDHAVHTTSQSSLIPSCTCDIYMNFLNSGDTICNDVIRSADVDWYYNCISWAGGIYCYYLWPPNEFTIIGTDTLATFDEFFSMNRYPGCSVFTREGATAENSVIDLWGRSNPDGSIHYTHASVRKNADNNAHGFDWESKMGYSIRIYHPRNQLPSIFPSYGQVVEHYRRVDTLNTYYSLYECISDGKAVIKNVLYSDAENSFINKKISEIPPACMEGFNILYNIWEKIWKTSIYSNPDMISDCNEYRDLLNFCSKNKNLKYRVFQKLGEGSLCGISLIKDLTKSTYDPIINKIFDNKKNEKYTESGIRIIHTNLSNTMTYVKELLSHDMGINNEKQRKQAYKTDIQYSNSDSFFVYVQNNVVRILFTNESEKRVSADIIDLNGSVITTFVDNEILPANTYCYMRNIPKGIYLVRYIVNNNINVKKVYVE